jgi:Spy/CpxP family protein refolding chaperone
MNPISTIVLVFLVGTALAFAQPGQLEPPGQTERGWERVEQLRKVRLIEMLDLKEEQSVRFFARLKEHEAARRELTKQKNDGLDKIERLLRNRADSAELTAVFTEVEGIDGKTHAEHMKFFEGLSDILSVEQQGKLLLFERRFERELRDAFREAQRRRHGSDEP